MPAHELSPYIVTMHRKPYDAPPKTMAIIYGIYGVNFKIIPKLERTDIFGYWD